MDAYTAHLGIWTAPLNSYGSGLRLYPMCRICSGIFPTQESQTLHEQYHYGQKENGTMSAVAWCDPGNHAFKAGIEGSNSGTMSIVNDKGQRESVQFDACPEHSFLGNALTNTVKELPNDLR